MQGLRNTPGPIQYKDKKWKLCILDKIENFRLSKVTVLRLVRRELCDDSVCFQWCIFINVSPYAQLQCVCQHQPNCLALCIYFIAINGICSCLLSPAWCMLNPTFYGAEMTLFVTGFALLNFGRPLLTVVTLRLITLCDRKRTQWATWGLTRTKKDSFWVGRLEWFHCWSQMVPFWVAVRKLLPPRG